MEITLNDLKYNKKREEYPKGYRIVYFYYDHYSIGEYCKTIEGFMLGFNKCDPIIDENDVPKFISVDDLLDKCLNVVPNAIKVALYTTYGEIVAEKERNVISKIHKN